MADDKKPSAKDSLKAMMGNVEESPSFAMGLLYQFAAHSSGLALENATINSDGLPGVNNASGRVLTALKNLRSAVSAATA